MSKKLSRSELIVLATKIMNGEGSESELNEWLMEFKKNVPHPAPSNLMFYSKDPVTPEQVVDQALAYKPIQL